MVGVEGPDCPYHAAMMAVSPKQTKKKGRRWLRRLLVLALIVVVGYFAVTQSFLTRWLVMSRASSLTGGIASASSVRIEPSGKLVIRDAKLRAPGVPGEAGTICSVERLEADFDWSSLWGPVAVHRIVLDQPLARIRPFDKKSKTAFRIIQAPKLMGGTASGP